MKVAGREFTFKGKLFAPGESFDEEWKDLDKRQRTTFTEGRFAIDGPAPVKAKKTSKKRRKRTTAKAK